MFSKKKKLLRAKAFPPKTQNAARYTPTPKPTRVRFALALGFAAHMHCIYYLRPQAAQPAQLR